VIQNYLKDMTLLVKLGTSAVPSRPGRFTLGETAILLVFRLIKMYIFGGIIVCPCVDYACNIFFFEFTTSADNLTIRNRGEAHSHCDESGI
jgi:hypothetical protein